MRSLRKSPRRFSPNKYFDALKWTRQDVKTVEDAEFGHVEVLKTDPLEFFRGVLGVEPTDYPKELIELFQKNQFVAARWSRQSGLLEMGFDLQLLGSERYVLGKLESLSTDQTCKLKEHFSEAIIQGSREKLPLADTNHSEKQLTTRSQSRKQIQQ